MDLLWTIAVILVILWLLGLVTSYTLGGFVHILLVLAIIVILIGHSRPQTRLGWIFSLARCALLRASDAIGAVPGNSEAISERHGSHNLTKRISSPYRNRSKKRSTP